MRVKVKSGWLYAGKEGDTLGPNVTCGQTWTPVLFDGDEDPEFCKADALQNVEAQNSTSNNTAMDAIALVRKMADSILENDVAHEDFDRMLQRIEQQHQ